MGDLVEGVLKRNEEKETDVAIAAKLFELLVGNQCDTDLAPACRTARRLFQDKNIGFAFPYRRKNKELAKLASFSFNIKSRSRRMGWAGGELPGPIAACCQSQLCSDVGGLLRTGI